MTVPTSFRLRPETLRELDRIAELLTDRARRERSSAEPGLATTSRSVTRAEALAAAVRQTHERLERELEVEPGSGPHRSAADAGRGILVVDVGVSLADDLVRERRAEAAAER